MMQKTTRSSSSVGSRVMRWSETHNALRRIKAGVVRCVRDHRTSPTVVTSARGVMKRPVLLRVCVEEIIVIITKILSSSSSGEVRRRRSSSIRRMHQTMMVLVHRDIIVVRFRMVIRRTCSGTVKPHRRSLVRRKNLFFRFVVTSDIARLNELFFELIKLSEKSSSVLLDSFTALK